MIFIPPAVSLGITAAKVILPVLGSIGAKRRASRPTGTPNQLPANYKTAESKTNTNTTRKEKRQERKDNRNNIVR